MPRGLGERHPESDYVDAVRSIEPAKTSEVAEIVDVTRQSAYYRLQRLEEDGIVTSEKTGNVLLWRVVAP